MARAPLRVPLLLLLVAVASSTGCQWVVSKHPLSDEKTSQIDERLLGKWEFIAPVREQAEAAGDDSPAQVPPRFAIGRLPGKENLLEMASVEVDSDGHIQVHRAPLAATKLGEHTYLSFQVGPPEPPEKRFYWIMRYEFSGEHEARLFLLDRNTTAAAIEREEVAGTVVKSPPDPSLPPAELVKQRNAPSLEAAFIGFLEDEAAKVALPPVETAAAAEPGAATEGPHDEPGKFSLSRVCLPISIVASSSLRPRLCK